MADGGGAIQRGRVPFTAEELGPAASAGGEAQGNDGDPAAQAVLGGMAFGQDRFPDARRHFEVAFTGFREQGDLRSAVRMAAVMADLHQSVLGNASVAAGWIGRGHALLEQIGACVEEGYLALAVVACDRTDMDEVERDAALALELALEYGDPDLEARALADGGLALVTQGFIQEGFARLDQAMAAISAGEVSDLASAGKSVCAMLTACERAGDIARAEEWTRLSEEVMVRQYGGHPRVLRMHCRVAFGSVLCTVGRWSEAESELARALGPDSSLSNYHRSLSLGLLAEMRLLQGRFEDAAALIEPYQDRLALALPLARLHLYQGDPSLAVAVALRALGELRGDRLRAAPLLALLVEAQLARDDVAAARSHSERLRKLSDEVRSQAVSAEAAIAQARVEAHCGDDDSALSLYSRARLLLGAEGRPLLCGVIRLETAQIRASAGDRDGAVADARAALVTFERVGADLLSDRTGALLRYLGWTGRGGGRATPAASRTAPLSARERDVLNLMRVGLTNNEIGARLFISPKTAEHHVGKVLSKLGVRSRAEAAAVATAALRTSSEVDEARK